MGLKIGIFSKLSMAGGSEFRCAEMANAISTHTEHQSFLLAEKDVPSRIEKYVNSNVKVVKNIFLPDPKNIDILYDMDAILIVNTDCKAFTHADYWLGKSERHGTTIDLARIKQMVFLFNFLVSPSRHLHTVSNYCKNTKIIVTNNKFFNEISSQDRYEQVRSLPRIKLESPINPLLYDTQKTPSSAIRFGMHSKGVGNKWNDEWIKLIEMCNKRLKGRVHFDFMGMPSSVGEKIKNISNVTVRKEDELTIRDYLNGIDVFTFFPSWKREEPWSRVVGEAMTSGCPVIATDKGGNKDQVIPGNNGFLCKKLDDFYKHIVYFTENQDEIEKMSNNSLLLAQEFKSENIANKFMRFISYGLR